MAKRGLSEDQRERVIELREQGLTQIAIAEVTGCTESSVAWCCLSEGIEAPRPVTLRPDYYLANPRAVRGNREVRAFPPEEDERLLDYAARGLSNCVIGRMLGRRHSSIKGRLLALSRRQARTEMERRT